VRSHRLHLPGRVAAMPGGNKGFGGRILGKNTLVLKKYLNYYKIVGIINTKRH